MRHDASNLSATLGSHWVQLEGMGSVVSGCPESGLSRLMHEREEK